jgi:Zn-dependent M28 family amino/carboxypeptidase
LETLGYDRKSIAGKDAFQPFDGIVRFECSPDRFDTVLTANVLGLLPGSDPYLSQEVIILGAHYDYVGNDPGGLRYSGANDNASGVAVLLEIARLLHEQDYRPKRSLLFAAWGAQELGQVGSNFYVTNPLFPVHDTIAMIQLDGVGGGDGFKLGVQGSTKTDGEVLFYINAAEQALEEKLVYTPPFNESDDTPFRQVGIPSVLISWRLANDDNLPDELGNAVHPERLGIAGRVITLLLLALAR